jgi:hypothetical protein
MTALTKALCRCSAESFSSSSAENINALKTGTICFAEAELPQNLSKTPPFWDTNREMPGEQGSRIDTNLAEAGNGVKKEQRCFTQRKSVASFLHARAIRHNWGSIPRPAPALSNLSRSRPFSRRHLMNELEQKASVFIPHAGK